MKPNFCFSFLLFFTLNFFLFSEVVWGTRKVLIDLPETPEHYVQNRYAPARGVLDAHHFLLPRVGAKNQGPLGTCAIFAASGCYEQHHPGIRVSEAEFAIYAETQIDDCIAGINLGRCLQLAQYGGFVLQDRLPYHEYVRYVTKLNGVAEYQLRRMRTARVCVSRDYNATMINMGFGFRLQGNGDDQTQYRLENLYWIHHTSFREVLDLSHVRNALARGYPVAVGADVYDGCWSPPQGPEASIIMPILGRNRQGRHAFILTGYEPGRFKFKNSWGTDWGDNGYAWIPDVYLQRYATELIAVGR